MSNVSDAAEVITTPKLAKVNKRDGIPQTFNPSKIEHSLKTAFYATKTSVSDEELDDATNRIIRELQGYNTISVSAEKVATAVKNVLRDKWPKAYDAYVIYRANRDKIRATKTDIIKNMPLLGTLREITDAKFKSSNILRDNANESGATPAGAYGKIGGEANKVFNLLNNIDPKYAAEHKDGYLHIHDLNMYNLSFNCMFAPIGKLLRNGFDSGTGYLRPAGRIESACQLTAVILQLQSNQQYGGIAADNLDFDLAPFVDLSFKKNLAREILKQRVYEGKISDEIFDYMVPGTEWDEIEDSDNPYKKAVKEIFDGEIIPSKISLNQPNEYLYRKFPRTCVKIAVADTDHATFEGMEGLVANLNSLQSRSGNQVPFSSINFGLDTSRCGRLVSINLIKAQYAGLGDGLTAIFPILVFKLFRGYTKDMTDPNYDLYLKSLKCLARRFYPNFVKVDSSYNLPYVKYETMEIPVSGKLKVKRRGGIVESELEVSELDWSRKATVYEYDPECDGNYWEILKIHRGVMMLRRLIPNTTISTMGCRTRVIGNINGTQQTTGRGNFAFHTLNLPRLAIEAHIAGKDVQSRKTLFFEKLDALLADAKGSLLDRFNLVCGTKTYENYPFTMQQGLYLTSDDKEHELTDSIAEVMKQSTLSIGYIGIAEVVTLLTGKTFGVDHEVDDFALSIVQYIREYCDKAQKETHLNWSCFATPAEAVAGRFASIDKNKFTTATAENAVGATLKPVKGLEDVDIMRIFGKGYYTNSHMMDFSLDTTLENKIKTEAPFHKITNAGHIFYYKVNGDPNKNIDAVKAAIDAMYEGDLGYFTITFDQDTCVKCGFHGIIDNECPHCGCNDENYIVRVRRITGYLTGSVRKGILRSWNDGKLAELKDRHNI